MFQGSMVALVTPMHEDGAVDFTALARLVEFQVENGTAAIIAVGTTGESATLDPGEHIEVVAKVVDYAAGRVPVIAGTGANATAEAVTLTREAMVVGADACLLVTPYYNKPGQEGLYRHFMAIAEAVAIPQILYNVPSRTACDMLPDTVERLSRVSNIVGIKEATGKLERAREILDRCGERLDVYSGDDAIAMEMILAGGKGVVSVTANVAPGKMSAMCNAALSGDRATAEPINQAVDALHRNLFAEANPIPVKWALSEMGMIPGGIRLPLTPLAEENRDTVRNAMLEAGIIQ